MPKGYQFKWDADPKPWPTEEDLKRFERQSIEYSIMPTWMGCVWPVLYLEGDNAQNNNQTDSE